MNNLIKFLSLKGYSKAAGIVSSHTKFGKSDIQKIPLAPGINLKLTLKSNEEVFGSYMGSTDSGILIDYGKTTSVPYNEIKEISVYWT